MPSAQWCRTSHRAGGERRSVLECMRGCQRRYAIRRLAGESSGWLLAPGIAAQNPDRYTGAGSRSGKERISRHDSFHYCELCPGLRLVHRHRAESRQSNSVNLSCSQKSLHSSLREPHRRLESRCSKAKNSRWHRERSGTVHNTDSCC